MSDRHLKFIKATDDTLILDGPIALFGGEDLTGEHFHQGTNFESKYTRTGRLLVDWEHGEEPDRDKTGVPIPQPGRDDVLGYIDWTTKRQDDIGLLARYVLDRRDRYVREFIEPMAKAKLLGTSSEAGRDIVKSADGRIDVWPAKRQALTVAPCEPKTLTDHQVQVLKGLSDSYPYLKALLPKAPGDGAASATEGDDYSTLQLQARAYLLARG